MRAALFAALAILTLCTGIPVVASQSANGYAAYRVSVVTPMGVHSVVVNETVKGTDRIGFNDLILQVTGSQQNLTYARLVNSSSNFFPFLNSIPAQSFEYNNGTKLSVRANFTQAGTENLEFQGSNHTLSVYSIALAVSEGNKTFAATGTIAAFPSSLVYSVNVQSGPLVQVDIVLLATDLQLSSQSSQMATAAYVGAGIGIGGLATAAALIVRRRERQSKAQEQKPMHWVD